MRNEEKPAFCIGCGKKTNYTVKSSREEITVRGITFTYVEQCAYCVDCGEEVYVPEINDLNAEAREEAYREATGLITIADIQDILTKYNIGAGPLANLMGFGEITINRYLSGQLPSRTHSDALLEVKKSYHKMEEYLETNKAKISSTAYRKCHLAIKKLETIYSCNKIDIIARYLLHKDSDITQMALQKMLYYAQSFYKAMYGRVLFADSCQAWSHGPVYRDIYIKYRDYQYDPIRLPNPEFDVDASGLTSDEMKFLDGIILAFGNYSASVLRNMTHQETPWIEARGSLQPMDRCSNVISSRSIDIYFKHIVDEYQIKAPCDISRYSRKMFDSIYRICF